MNTLQLFGLRELGRLNARARARLLHTFLLCNSGNPFNLCNPLVAALMCLLPGQAADTAPRNLALQAQASAFEEYQGMSPALANDGNMETRWSGIPGHNLGGWFQLEWAQPVRVAEVVVFQHDRYVKEMDLQVWDSTHQVWLTLQHLGRPDRRLPKVVVCRFPARLTTRVRLANITNGPSFTEVQVFEEPYSQPPAVNLASDADGHFIGMVSDAWGSEPLAGTEVVLSGQAKSGPWQTTARSDDHGLFFLPMPLGLSASVTANVRIPNSERPPPAGGSRFGPLNPSPALKGTLSPSEGEREGGEGAARRAQLHGKHLHHADPVQRRHVPIRPDANRYASCQDQTGG